MKWHFFIGKKLPGEDAVGRLIFYATNERNTKRFLCAEQPKHIENTCFAREEESDGSDWRWSHHARL